MPVQIKKIPTSIRLTPNRKIKVEAIALEEEKTVTQVISDLIDKAPDPREATA